MDSIQNIWFKLFASCTIVVGKSNSLIYDLEKSTFYDLPNKYLDILEMTKTKNVLSIMQSYNNKKEIKAFFNQFIEEEIGFYTTEPESFPNINFTWESPNYITNCIIEIENLRNFDYVDLINQLDALACKALQVRLLNSFSKDSLLNIINAFNCLRINHVELLIPYEIELTNDDLFLLLENQPRLNRIVIYDAPDENFNKNEGINKALIYLKKDFRIDSNEVIKVERFTTNIEMFSEAQNYNLGLNRKLCIDKNGNIKNYLSHHTAFGNINKDKIKDIAAKVEFQEKWFISNDKIEICKDCQYRFACVSNSDVKIKEKKYFKTEMCNFNPINNKWS